MRKRSLAARIFIIVLISNILVLLTLLSTAFLALEELETAFLEAMKKSEISYFEKYIDKTQPYKVQTHESISLFRPASMTASMDLPILFQNLAIPFEGEVETIAGEYMVVVYPTKEGVFFFAKNLDDFERHEKSAVTYMLWLSSTVILLSLFLAFITSRLIARPIEKISSAIQGVNTNTLDLSIEEDFIDKELMTIASVINALFTRIHAAVKRERSLIALASHELRTPIAVILGAANVIENRQQLQSNDALTLQRMIKSATDMSATIEALLSLVRQTKTVSKNERINIHQLLHDIQQEYQLHNRADNQRIIINESANDIYINSDRLLITLLIQNIINNALDHALGNISIELQHDHLDISDQGLASGYISSHATSSSGLGLYIVDMICEHLQWRYEIASLENIGTRVRIFFTKL